MSVHKKLMEARIRLQSIKMKKSGIYKISNIKTGMVYIGGTVDIKARLCCHISSLSSGSHKSRKLQEAWDVYGKDCFYFDFLLECDQKNLLMYEQIFIDFYDSANNGYNMLPTAGNATGLKHSGETKKKMKDAWVERRLRPPQYHSEEAKKKISKSKIGKKRKPFSDEARRNMSLARMGNKNRLGIPHTQETKEKMRLSRAAKKSGGSNVNL